MEAEDGASAERSQGSTQGMATDGCNNNDANDLDGLDSGPEPTAPTVATDAASQDVTPAPAEQQPAALAAVAAPEPCQAVTETRKTAAERWHGIKALVARRQNHRTENNHGETPLHVACRKGKVKVVGIMVQHGSNNGYLHELLDKRDANGETAEMCSSSRTAIAALKGQYCHAYEGSQMTSVINSLHWTDPSGTSRGCTIL